MPRSLLARSLEPLVAILWGLLLAWTVWVAAVWILGIGPAWLGLAGAEQPPPNEDLRKALLLLAENADVAWLVLAVMNLHLVVTDAYGLRSARAWLGFTAGSAFLLGLLNDRLGAPFGWMAFGGSLGLRLAGVAVGWLLLWSVLVMSARETVLWARPRASHAVVAALTAAIVLLTMANIESPARFVRGWWIWHAGEARNPVPMSAWAWAAWLVWPWLTAFAMREKDVAASVVGRSVRPMLILLLLNAIALGTRCRVWIQG
jgi:hypothetical protein